MATMNISLPDELKAYVEARVKSGEYANASDFVRDLIRHNENRRVKLEKLRGAIQDGRASGSSGQTFEQILEDARAEATRRGYED